LAESVHIVDVSSGKVHSQWPDAQFVGVAHDSEERVILGETNHPPSQGRLRIVDIRSGGLLNEIAVAICDEPSYSWSDDYNASVSGHWLAVNEPFEPPLQNITRWLHDRFPSLPAANLQTAAVRIYDTQTGRCRAQTASAYGRYSFLLSPNGQMLAVQRDNSIIDVFDLPPRKPLTWFALAAALLALPLAGLAWRRSRCLRRGVA
jgi:hypothetical protein